MYQLKLQILDIDIPKQKRKGRRPRTATSIDVDGVEQSKMQYDSTGMYHWCPSRDIDSCLMDRQEAAMTVLQVSCIVTKLVI